MEHREYKKINNSDTAVLFIHGIVGTPNHFKEFIPLVPDSYSVYNMLLDGHGKSVRDFSKASMKKWALQVENAVNELSENHGKIYIVAHSMGCLLAIEQAVKNKKICKMFLLAVPLALFLKPRLPINSLKVYFNAIRPDDNEAVAAKRCYGIADDKNIFHYIGWIPRFSELFAKIRKTRPLVKEIACDCSVYYSRKDEMVSKRSLKYLKTNPRIQINELENSTHYYYDKNDFDYLLSEFESMINPFI